MQKKYFKIEKLRRFAVPTAVISFFLLSSTLSSAVLLPFGSTINYEIDLDNNQVKLQTKGTLILDKNILTDNSEQINASTTRFYASPQFFNEGNAWYEIDYSTTTPENFIDLQVSVFKWWEIPHALADIIFPSSDGTLSRHGSASWVVTRDSADSDVADSVSATRDFGVSISGGAYYLDRTAFFFDTSSISPNVIDTASVYIDVAVKDDQDSTTYTLYSTTQSGFSNGSSNYSSCGSTALSDTNEDPANSGYRQFLLNASGEANINTSGTSKFCLRFLLDVVNSAPPGLNGVTVTMSEQTGTSEDPYLDVTYSAPTPTPASVASSTMYLTDDPAITMFWGFIFFGTGFWIIYYYYHKRHYVVK